MGKYEAEDDTTPPQSTQNSSVNVSVDTGKTGKLFSSTNSPVQNVVINPDVMPPINEEWFKSQWRPAASWLYLGICAFDFVLAPVFNFWFSYATHLALVPWAPLTLQGSGLFHISFGAIVGIYAYGRSKEKLAGVS